MSHRRRIKIIMNAQPLSRLADVYGTDVGEVVFVRKGDESHELIEESKPEDDLSTEQVDCLNELAGMFPVDE